MALKKRVEVKEVVKKEEVKKEFAPCWMYSKDGARLVKTEEEMKALGKDFQDKPFAKEMSLEKKK